METYVYYNLVNFKDNIKITWLALTSFDLL